MKTTKIKASLLSVIFTSVVIFGTTSCENHEEKKADEVPAARKTEEVAKEQNAGKFNDNDDEKNAKFLVKAAEINLEEISLGKLAQEKSKNADVKALGKMMETAHTKALADLTGLAGKKNISIPTVTPEDAVDFRKKLNDGEEKDFNKKYVDKMVSGHKDAIDLFEKQSTESSDADIRAWAAASLPELRKHLDHSVAIQDKLNKLK